MLRQEKLLTMISIIRFCFDLNKVHSFYKRLKQNLEFEMFGTFFEENKLNSKLFLKLVYPQKLKI